MLMVKRAIINNTQAKKPFGVSTMLEFPLFKSPLISAKSSGVKDQPVN